MGRESDQRYEALDRTAPQRHRQFHFPLLDPNGKPSARELTDRLAALAPFTGRRVLDIGAGRGGPAQQVCRRWQHPTWICVDRARYGSRRAGNISLRADAQSLPIAAGSIDTVWCLEASLHFPSLVGFLTESARVIEEGGQLLWCDFMPAGLDGQLENLLERIGFTDLQIVDWSSEVLEAVKHPAWVVQNSGDACKVARDVWIRTTGDQQAFANALADQRLRYRAVVGIRGPVADLGFRQTDADVCWHQMAPLTTWNEPSF
jgi:SAM-dependent methyltransferase